MGNLCNCFKNEDPILPVYEPKTLKPIEKGMYQMIVTIWPTLTPELYDVRFSFYSNSAELDNLLWKVLNYSAQKAIKKEIGPLTAKNQVILFLKQNEINALKSELEKYPLITLSWRKFT